MSYLIGLKQNKIVEIYRSPFDGSEMAQRLANGEFDSVRSVESIDELIIIVRGEINSSSEVKNELKEAWSDVMKDVGSAIEDIKNEAKSLKDLPRNLFSETEWAKIVLAKAKLTDWLSKLGKKNNE